MGRKVAIVGAALSDCGRVDDKTAYQLHHQATTRALADAGISRDEVDGFMSHGTGNLPPIELAEYLGLASHVEYIDSTGVGGSCWEIFLEHAVAAIAEGQVETVVLSYGSTSRADLKRRTRSANLYFGNRGPAQFDAPFGHTLIAKHAMSARRHMYEFGTTIEQLAEIAVSARYNAGLNPLAYYRDPITIEDVQSSRMIADPFTKLHCCIRSDGGGAIVLTSEERARDCAEHARVGARSRRGDLAHHDERMGRLHRVAVRPFGEEGLRSGRGHARGHRRRRGLRLVHLDRACSPWRASASARRARAARSSRAARSASAARFPTNTDGGGLSSCQPGMRGIFLLVEAVEATTWRMRRPPGRRRSPGLCERDRRLDLVHGHCHPRSGLTAQPAAQRAETNLGTKNRQLGNTGVYIAGREVAQPAALAGKARAFVSRYSSNPWRPFSRPTPLCL